MQGLRDFIASDLPYGKRCIGPVKCFLDALYELGVKVRVDEDLIWADPKARSTVVPHGSVAQTYEGDA